MSLRSGLEVRRARELFDSWAPTYVDDDEIELITRAVSRVTGLSREELIAADKIRGRCSARYLWWASLRHFAKMSFPDLGALVDRDHRSVARGCNLVPTELVFAMARAIDELRAESEAA